MISIKRPGESKATAASERTAQERTIRAKYVGPRYVVGDKSMNTQKTTRWIVALGIVLLVGAAAAQEAPTGNKPQEKVAEAKAATEGGPTDKTAQETLTIQSRKDRLSYAFGVDLARDLKRQRNDLNVDMVVTALTDALADKKLLMTDEEVATTLKTFDQERKQDFEHAKSMLAQKNKKAGQEFFAKNLRREGIVTLPSGLQYKVLKQGDGKTPTLDDKVVCNYRGTLLDGKEFDSSYKTNQPATVPVKGLIKGWSEALQLMPVGSKWQLFIPPQLAYGERVVGGIAPNAMLIFEVELISIVDKAQNVQDKNESQGVAAKSQGGF
jgi:FKBP-type peptidyl-prolyl cis-trans isomerase FklB